MDNVYESERRRLFGLAYRLLGSAAEAEDAVQDAFVRWQTADQASIERPAAWLTRVVTNGCLTRLTSARARRETYVGEWLPEPVATTGGALGPDDTVEQRESVSMALLTLLEKLSPTERAVYVLRDAFSYGYPEIAGILDLSEANCRQLHRRAGQRLADDRTRFAPSTDEWRQLVERFLAAASNGDLAELEELFTADVTVWTDGGGKKPAGRRPVVGKTKVTRLFRGGFHKYLAGVQLRIHEVNGEPAVVGFVGPELFGVMTIEITDGRVSGVRSVVNPEKLGFLRRQLSQTEGLPGQHG